MAETKIVNLEVNSNLAETEKSVGSLKAQLRAAQSEVASLSDKFGATSKEAVQAAKRAGELKDKIGDAKNLTDAFNPDAKFKALTASLGGVSSAFGAYQGALGLAGVENKDLEKQILKVQSAMAISQGLQSIGESVDSFKQLGAVIKNTSIVQKAMTAATAAYTFVTEAATGGLKLFRLALVSTGIGALVIGVGLLIANFDTVKKVIMNLIPGLAKVGDFVSGIVNSITDFVGATSEAGRALDKLKKDADNTLKVNQKFLDEHGSQLDEYTKKKIEAKNAYAEALKKDGSDQVALAKELNRKLEAIEYSRGDEARKIQKEAHDKSVAEANKQAEQKRLAKLKAAQDEKDALLKSYHDAEDAYDADQKKIKEERLARDMKSAQDAIDILNSLKPEETPAEKENREYQEKLAILEANNLSTEELTKKHVNNLKVIQKTSADSNKAIAKAEAKAKIDSLDLYADALGSISGLLGESTDAGKAAAVASTTISTYAGATKAFEAQQIEGDPTSLVRGVIAAGIVVASGLMNVQKILAVQTPGGGGGGGSAPTAGGAPAAPSFNVIGQSGANQIAQSINGREAAPIKAYVLGSDVTTQQGMNRRIIQNASIG